MSNGWFRLAIMSFVGIIMSVIALAVIPLIIPNDQSHSGAGHQTGNQPQHVDTMSQYPNPNLNSYQYYHPGYGYPGYMGQGNGLMGQPYQGVVWPNGNPYNSQEYQLMKMQIEQLKLRIMEMQMQLQNNQGSSSNSMGGMSMM